MKFFVPNIKRSEHQDVYDGISKLLKDQLRMPITDRRIHSLSYTHDKKLWHAEVGKMEQQEGRYEILAIFESKPYIVYSRAKNGDHGLTILVNGDEITDIKDFD